MSEARDAILEIRERIAAVQSTGCRGAAGYLDWARENGYKHVEPLNQCSSAGDWQFLVSVDRQAWKVLCQENRWPLAGFEYYIDSEVFWGTLDEVYQQIDDLTGGF